MSTHEALPAFEADRRTQPTAVGESDNQPFLLPLWDMVHDPLPPLSDTAPHTLPAVTIDSMPDGTRDVILTTMPFEPAWQSDVPLAPAPDTPPSPATAAPMAPPLSSHEGEWTPPAETMGPGTPPLAPAPDTPPSPATAAPMAPPLSSHEGGLSKPHVTTTPAPQPSGRNKKASRRMGTPTDPSFEATPVAPPLSSSDPSYPLVQEVFAATPHLSADTQPVDGCWEAVTALLDLLQSLKTDRDAWDQKVPSWKARVAAHITTSDSVFRELDQGFERLWRAYSQLTPLQQRPIAHSLHAMVKKSGLIDSTINRHIMSRPFGYAGDYQAIDYLYDYADAWLGTSSYELLLNDYTTSIPIAYSTCLRKSTLTAIILDHLRDTPDPHVVSVGAGRAREWEALLRSGQITRPLMLTLVDMDARALAAIHDWVGTLSEAHRSLIAIRTIHQDIRTIIRQPLSFSHAPSLVYAMGLFDYLPDRLARPLIYQLSLTLSETGSLWVSNVNQQHQIHRAYYELMGGWELIFRGPDDLLSWCTDLGLSGSIIDPSDPHNTHSYLHIRR